MFCTVSCANNAHLIQRGKNNTKKCSSTHREQTVRMKRHRQEWVEGVTQKRFRQGTITGQGQERNKTHQTMPKEYKILMSPGWETSSLAYQVHM